MAKKSAGIILYRYQAAILQVLLVHPGGPFWAKKDVGVWSIPKGEFDETESPFDAALREVKEETGLLLAGNFTALQPVKQKSGKLVYAWALQKDIDATQIKSNSFQMEWPPKSGKQQSFPEVNAAAWFSLEEAAEKILAGQLPLLQELQQKFNKQN
ncbi:MAG: NUDIX domain-containing protein [Ferruginibacter sp.]|nr:NUDIX domain-containing protein [Ferruginibacter sp.]